MTRLRAEVQALAATVNQNADVLATLTEAVNQNAQVAIDCINTLHLENRVLRAVISDLSVRQGAVMLFQGGEPSEIDFEHYTMRVQEQMRREEIERTSTQAPPVVIEP